MATSETLTRIPAHSHGLSNLDIPEHRAVAETRTSKMAEDSMDISPTKTSPPAESSKPSDKDNGQQNDKSNAGGASTNGGASSQAGGASAAAAGGQPKVVQTAFIHKLYNMLEDQTIQHLISWSSSNESFLIQPSSEFSKVLSSYFKHTNISSFVRQLNMYGFHKVSDVFHTGSSETPLWEFKHGNGNFRRGDLQGLREIKRRASRHSLVHRESYSGPSKLPPPAQPPPPVPTTAAAPTPVPAPPTVEAPPETIDSRVLGLEHHFYDMRTRLDRAEDLAESMAARCHLLVEKLTQAYQYNIELSTMVSSLVHEPDHQIRIDVSRMQQNITADIQSLQSVDGSPPFPPSSHRAYLAAAHDHAGPPLSPRQVPQDYERRGSQQSAIGGSRPQFFRPLAPTPKRYGSIGTNAAHSPASFRSPPPPRPLPPLDGIGEEPHSGYSFGRRHTSHDIRTTPGWHAGLAAHNHNNLPPANGLSSPFSGGNSSAPYPSSPRQGPSDTQHVRDSLAQYKLPGPPESASRRGSIQLPGPLSRPQSPRGADPNNLPPFGGGGSNWNTLPGARPAFKDVFKNAAAEPHPVSSAPATRKSSLSSNLHTILNPSNPSDRDGGSPGAPEPRDDERKRRRLG